MKPERCGSPLVQEKYQEEKACDKRKHNNNNNNNNNNNIGTHLCYGRKWENVGEVELGKSGKHSLESGKAGFRAVLYLAKKTLLLNINVISKFILTLPSE